MKLELNDETLTAYALGELDPAETRAVEKLLAEAARAGDDAPRVMLGEIRSVIGVTEAAFAESGSDIELTAEQRAALETAAISPQRSFWTRSRLANIAAVAAIIAILAAIVVPNRAIYIQKKKDLTVASQERPPSADETPASVPAQNDVTNVPFFLNTREGVTVETAPPAAEPAPLPQETREQLEAVGYGEREAPKDDAASRLDALDPGPDVQAAGTAVVQSEALSADDDRTGFKAAEANVSPSADKPEPKKKEPIYLADSGETQPRGDTNEVHLGKELTAQETLSASAAPEPATEPAPTLEWKRRPRPEEVAPQPVRRSNRIRQNIEQDVKLYDRSAAAASPSQAPAAPSLAPAAAAAAPKYESLPEISADTLFAPAAPPPSPASISVGQSIPLASQPNKAGLQEQEELHALGYLSDSQLAAGSRFQTAAIRDRTGFSTRQPAEPRGTESYAWIPDSPFIRVGDQPLSTFSIDVDTASYSNMRRFIEQGQLPPPDAVRVEELINYFDYAYPAPTDGRPFATHFESTACPWMPEHTLVRIGLKGREVPRAERPATNLVFLIDVSGSMQPDNKLPLVKRAMAMLTRQLDERDRVTIVTYASGVNLALPVTSAARQDVILNAIESLGAGGSTNGAGGIQLAYESARRNFLPGGTNRVILATDGDFNVGISDNDSLLALIQQEAKSGVFLSVFGFGMGNLKDDKLEMLADKGNGVYGYIDSESEARKVFVEKLTGTLVTIAKDVKIQVEFNPSRVAAYKLIGYENRALAAQDFNDDRKDAGEIGAGHTVTALYEIVPAGRAIPAEGTVDTLRYQSPQATLQNEAAKAIAPAGTPSHADELLLVKLRYKEPEGAESKLLEFPLKGQTTETPSADLKFASAVAAFGKMLRGGSMLNYDTMLQLAQAGLAASDDPHRAEMVHLMLRARPQIESRFNDPQAHGLTLENIAAAGDGTYRARIRTSSRTAWYQTGQAFEQYSVLSIEPSSGCVMLFDAGRNAAFRLCMPTYVQ